MANSKFHLIRSYCEIFFYNFPIIPCLKYTVNSNFHLIRSKILPTNDFELTVPDLYDNTWVCLIDEHFTETPLGGRVINYGSTKCITKCLKR